MNFKKRHITDDPHFHVLFENSIMIAGHVFEDAYCYNKLTKEELPIYVFYGNPDCAIVGNNNDWCLFGGNVLVLRTWADNTIRIIDELKEIYAFKAINEYTVHVLIDPWSDKSAIWQLEIDLTSFSSSMFPVSR